jgi:hypothetical protein
MKYKKQNIQLLVGYRRGSVMISGKEGQAVGPKRLGGYRLWLLTILQ